MGPAPIASAGPGQDRRARKWSLFVTDFLLDPDPAIAATPIHLLDAEALSRLLPTLTDQQREFVSSLGFDAKAGRLALLPGEGGRIAAVLFGLGESESRPPFLTGSLPALLPAGNYRFANSILDKTLASVGFALGAYRFERYRKSEARSLKLVLAGNCDPREVRRLVAAVTLVRDLINTPANDLGPAELGAAARELAGQYGAVFGEIAGKELAEAFPLLHAVGRAASSTRAPRLIDFTWGKPGDPKITLVGKGVVFDTGGLDIKPSSNMLLMKKDMGGAANVLGLAMLVMDAALPVRLRVIVPTAENAIAGDAFRPSDILRSRKGLSVEIGNTDAEGRLILADALTLAFEEEVDLVIDLATLTGAARVALGPELPAIFSGDDALAADLMRLGSDLADPLWRLPLWPPYMAMLDSKIADINNAGSGSFAGSITAALFLSRFVADPNRWLHGDIFAWNPSARPGRPEGGEAQAIRALYGLLKERYGR